MLKLTTFPPTYGGVFAEKTYVIEKAADDSCRTGKAHATRTTSSWLFPPQYDGGYWHTMEGTVEYKL